MLDAIGDALIDQLKDNPCTCGEVPDEPISENHRHSDDED